VPNVAIALGLGLIGGAVAFMFGEEYRKKAEHKADEAEKTLAPEPEPSPVKKKKPKV
jgi:hypothetical protein